MIARARRKWHQCRPAPVMLKTTASYQRSHSLISDVRRYWSGAAFLVMLRLNRRS